jgi:hypothetical protein
MKDYLRSLIFEQTNRALTLKKLIRFPLPYPELSGLAERCRSILDSQVVVLKDLSQVLNHPDAEDARDIILRELRACVRGISTVEYHGIPALYTSREPEARFLNKLVYRISEEIGLPFPAPSVCCIATDYYHTSPFTNVIFAPLSESEFLMHLSDLYHEIGHHVSENAESEVRLRAVAKSYNLASTKVTDHYSGLLKAKRMEFGPDEIPMIIERIHSHWKYWLREFFCDLFALYTVGPSFAWSHLHLTVKIGDDIHGSNLLLQQTHPSDEARMRLLLLGLRKLGLNEDAQRVESKWFEFAKPTAKPPVEYQYAYPDTLLNEISKLIFEGLRDSGFALYSKELLVNGSKTNIRVMLNEAWRVFWESKPEDYRVWEENRVATLRSVLS